MKPSHTREFAVFQTLLFLRIISLLIWSTSNRYASMVSGILKQTVERQGSLVFCVSKSSEAERERMEPPERNERVCVEIPTPGPIQMRYQT